jgi:hypothetical protein
VADESSVFDVEVVIMDWGAELHLDRAMPLPSGPGGTRWMIDFDQM